jgi:hypothetical protein
MASGTSFISKKNTVKEQGFLRKSHQKTYGTRWTRDPETFIPDPGGKKAPDPGSGSATLIGTILYHIFLFSGGVAEDQRDL